MKKIFILIIMFTYNADVKSQCNNQDVIESYTLPNPDSADHLYYKNGKVINGIDSTGPVFNDFWGQSQTEKFYSLCYYTNGKRTKALEFYVTSHKKRTEFDYDTNQKIIDGIYTIWDEDSSSQLVEFKGGCENGLVINFDSNRHLNSIWSVENGRFSTQYSFFNNGEIQRRVSYPPMGGMFYVGVCIEWYKNGNKKVEANHLDGTALDGPVKQWYEDGRVKTEGQWRNKKKEGEWWCYSQFNKSKKKLLFRNDSLIAAKYYDEYGNEMLPYKLSDTNEVKREMAGTWVDCTDTSLSIVIKNDNISFKPTNPWWDGGITNGSYYISDTCCHDHRFSYKSIKLYVNVYNFGWDEYGILFLNKNYLDLVSAIYPSGSFINRYYKRKENQH